MHSQTCLLVVCIHTCIHNNQRINGCPHSCEDIDGCIHKSLTRLNLRDIRDSLSLPRSHESGSCSRLLTAASAFRRSVHAGRLCGPGPGCSARTGMLMCSHWPTVMNQSSPQGQRAVWSPWAPLHRVAAPRRPDNGGGSRTDALGSALPLDFSRQLRTSVAGNVVSDGVLTRSRADAHKQKAGLTQASDASATSPLSW